MPRHWLLRQAQPLPSNPASKKKRGVPGDDDDIDFTSKPYSTKTDAAPGDDDDIDFHQELRVPDLLQKKTMAEPTDDDDDDF